MDFSYSNKEMLVRIEKSCFSESVVFKCFYWYTKLYTVRIDGNEYDNYIVTLKGVEQDGLDELEAKISMDLIDFKVRDIIVSETKAVRELIVAKAFSHYDDYSSPSTDISDPVGFKPEVISDGKI